MFSPVLLQIRLFLDAVKPSERRLVATESKRSVTLDSLPKKRPLASDVKTKAKSYIPVV